MTRKPIEGQQALFYGDGRPMQIYDDFMVEKYYQALEDSIPMVDILDRAVRIKEALTEMGKMSQIGIGFLTAIDTPSGDRIWSHYRRATPIVENNARNKLPRREQRVRCLLGPATGFAALRASNTGTMSLDEINARSKHTWERFVSRFQGPDNNHRRQEYKSKLSKQATAQKRLRKRLGIQLNSEAA